VSQIARTACRELLILRLYQRNLHERKLRDSSQKGVRPPRFKLDSRRRSGKRYRGAHYGGRRTCYLFRLARPMEATSFPTRCKPHSSFADAYETRGVRSDLRLDGDWRGPTCGVGVTGGGLLLAEGRSPTSKNPGPYPGGTRIRTEASQALPTS
jgi:hypothetical protein